MIKLYKIIKFTYKSCEDLKTGFLRLPHNCAQAYRVLPTFSVFCHLVLRADGNSTLPIHNPSYRIRKEQCYVSRHRKYSSQHMPVFFLPEKHACIKTV